MVEEVGERLGVTSSESLEPAVVRTSLEVEKPPVPG